MDVQMPLAGKRLYKLLPFILFANLPFESFADEIHTPEISQNNYSPAVKVSEEHIIRASGGINQNLIPESVYYKVIFKKIIAGDVVVENFAINMVDWEVIRNLPSHRDAEFEQVSYQELTDVCESIYLNSSNLNNDTILGLALQYHSSMKNSEQRLLDHYDDVLSKLSRSAKDLIKAEKDNLIQSKSVGYSRIDMVGYAIDNPSGALDRMLAGCFSINKYVEEHPPQARKLFEDSSIALPMTPQ